MSEPEKKPRPGPPQPPTLTGDRGDSRAIADYNYQLYEWMVSVSERLDALDGGDES